MRALAVSLVVLALAATPSARAGTAAEIYNHANALYLAGDYQGALDLYNSIDVKNPDLEYNRAAAYLKTGDIGRAVVHFNRALRLRPGDEDAKASLAYIRSIKADREKPASRGAAYKAAAALLYTLPLGVMTWGALTLYMTTVAAAVALMLARSGRVRRWAARGLIVCGVFFVLWTGATAFRAYEFERDDRAVAVAEEIDARAAPSGAAERVFSFHEGTEVTLGRIEGDFVLVTLSSGVSGWVDRLALERI